MSREVMQQALDALNAALVYPQPLLGRTAQQIIVAMEALRAALAKPDDVMQQGAPSIEAARAMGETGGPVVEAERLAFEAWMAGHCWALCATWDGTSYRGSAEHPGYVDPRAMNTRQLWASWRDRAALAALAKPDDKAQPVAHVAGDEIRRYLEWNPAIAAFNLPVGTALYAASQLPSEVGDKAQPSVPFEDARVQKVYEILCHDDAPPTRAEHWEGYRARQIVDALLGDKAQPVAWMDDFGNVFPLAANKGAGSWMDEHKRDWKPLYAAPQPQAEQPFQPDWMNYRQGVVDGKAEAERGAELSDYPPLPEPDGYIALTEAGSVVVPPREFKKHNAYAVFTAEQVRQAQRDAIAADRVARGRKPLTDEQIGKAWACVRDELVSSASTKRRLVRAIEAAHGITNKESSDASK